jgi:polyphosphate kinase
VTVRTIKRTEGNGPSDRQGKAPFHRLSTDQLDAVPGPLGLANLIELTKLDRPDLKDPPLPQKISPVLVQSDIFAVIRERDVLLYHPYDSFLPILNFLRDAAKDLGKV